MIPINLNKHRNPLRPIGGPIFYFSEACPLCAPTLAKIAPIFIAQDVQLVIRKPYPSELSLPGFAFPALLLPKGVFGVEKPTLMVGANLADALAAMTAPEEEEDLSQWINPPPLN